MININVSCSLEEAKKLFKELDFSKASMQVSTYQHLTERLELIKKNMPFELIRSEYLWRRMRTKGYSRGRKTFMRDLTELEREGFLTKKTRYGGLGGTHTDIKRC